MRVRKSLKSLLLTVGMNNESSREAWLKEALLTIPANSRILDAGCWMPEPKGTASTASI